MRISDWSSDVCSSDLLLARWRRRCSEATPKRFSHRAGFGLAWGGLEVLRIAVFAGIALLIGWLLLPALATPLLTLVIVLSAITKARPVLTISRFLLPPAPPTIPLAPPPDPDAS